MWCSGNACRFSRRSPGFNSPRGEEIFSEICNGINFKLKREWICLLWNCTWSSGSHSTIIVGANWSSDGKGVGRGVNDPTLERNNCHEWGGEEKEEKKKTQAKAQTGL